MIKHIFITCFSLTAMLLLTGCMENGILINVNPDGTGKITFRAFQSPQASQMSSEEGVDPSKEAQEAIDGSVGDLGAGDKISGRAITNKKGWPGYEGVYHVPDINKLTFPASDGMNGYDFKLTPGPTAKLEITTTVDEGHEKRTAEKSAEDFEKEMAEMGPMMAMMDGMRVTYMVKINGTVESSNAEIVGAGGKEAFILLDLKMAEALKNPAAMAIMKKYKGATPKEGVNVAGYKLQDPSEPVMVTFK